MSDSIYAWDEFIKLARVEQALVFIWECELHTGSIGLSLPEINSKFIEHGLPKQNQFRLNDRLRKHKGARKIKSNLYSVTSAQKNLIEERFSGALKDHKTRIADITRPSYVKDAVYSDLQEMSVLYAHLFLLENSIRGLIETKLNAALGESWWDIAANSSMKNKHKERIRKENENKWAPTRSELGPLYALDWPDLITIIRKYEDEFSDVIGNISFMHRYEDLGLLRNVVAHNGVISDETQFIRVKLALEDWLKQTRI